MIYPTQFLKTIMVLVTLCLPIGLGVNLTYFISAAVRKKKICIDYLGMIISYSIIILISVLSGVGRPFDTNIKLDWLGLLVAVVCGGLCILIEYFVGVLLTYLSTKRWILKISVHSVYGNANKIDVWDILAVGAFVVLEELIFRSALINVLSEFELSIIWIAAIAVAVFALNHAHWGLFVFIQKLFSGAVFVLLYLIFDNNIIVPIVAHLVQNFTLLWLSRRIKNE